MQRFIYLAIGLVFLISCSAPRAAFQTENKSVKMGEEIQFANVSKNSESYYWDFGDGNTSEEQSPTHIFWNSGRYDVKLMAKNADKTVIKSKEIVVEPIEKCLVMLSTSKGDMVLELYDATPFHRDNFTKLVEEKYYDGLLFHRIISNFMVQGGDPDSRNAKSNKSLGRGGPGYTVPAEIREEYVHVKGALAAARMPDVANPEKASSGSQFYIVHGKKLDRTHLDRLSESRGLVYTEDQIKDYIEFGGTPHLDGEYTVFGRVIHGLEIIDKIAGVKKGKGDRPKVDIEMSAVLLK